MNIQEIKEKLIVTFSSPLREYYKRHVVFWNDPEKEFLEVINDLLLDGVTIVKLTNNNFFRTKQLINDDSTGNLLIYDTTNSDLHDDWLADARLYCDEILHFDFYSIIMSKLGILESRSMRDTIKQYEKFWKNEKRIDELHKIAPVIQSTTELHIAILAVLCNAKKPEIPEILFNIFTNGLSKDNNRYIKNIESFGCLEILWKIINKYVGDCHENLTNAFESILISALYQTMGSKVPSKIRTLVFGNSVIDCHSLVSEWTHNSEYSHEILEMINNVDFKLELFELFDALSLDELINSDIFPSINEALLRKLFTACSTRAISGNRIISMVEERRKQLWYDKYSNYYECLNSIGEFFKLHDKYVNGFHYINEVEIWKDYQNELCLYDTYYRHIHYYVYKSSINTIENVQDKLKDAISYIENIYKNHFINGLNDVWVNHIKDSLDFSGRINDTIRVQSDFFKNYVEDNSNDRLTVVIVSDGMRYEVAKELTDSLKYQLKCDVKLDAIQSVFPSITKYGKPSLLPGVKTIDESMNVLVDSSKVNDINSRKAMLQKHIYESDAINYVDLFKMNSTEKKEFLKGKKVVYVYHDDIDSSGHDSSGESKVFDSCKETIDKLLNLVKSLTNARSSIRILITSDHGFLYSYQKLEEVDKLTIKSDEIVDGLGEKRCLVCKRPISSDFLIPVKLLINNESNSLYGYAPYQAIRIKSNGGPSNYVHGGISLQEMTVPVIIYDNVRTDSKGYRQNEQKYNHEPVKVDLVTENKTIYGLIAKIELYQVKPVGLDAVETTYEVLFEDKMGKPVSDSKIIIANKIDSDASNRRFTITLNLNPQIKSDTYYLLIINQETHETLSKVEFRIENSFGGDFDF